MFLPETPDGVVRVEPRALETQVRGGTETILVVEDEQQVRELVCSLLETHGYKIDWHEYGMPHSVCAEEIDDIATFLKRTLLTA